MTKNGDFVFFLFKIVKIDQLQIGVESTNDSGFFHFKHSVTIAEQKNYTWKISAGDHPLKKIPSHHGNMVTRYNAAGRFQSIKYFYLKIVNKTKRLRFWIILSVFVKISNIVHFFDFDPS